VAVEGELVEVNEPRLLLLVHLQPESMHNFSWFSGTEITTRRITLVIVNLCGYVAKFMWHKFTITSVIQVATTLENPKRW